jgi:uncharacterized cupin superfamily protein
MRNSPVMVPEARLEHTHHGLVPKGNGWFVVNAREAPWREQEGRGLRCRFEGAPAFPQLGVSLYVLGPDETIGLYHWEADQEDFLILDGEALLIIEGEERTLTRWDFVHCPAETEHVMIGAGQGPCVVLAVGARDHSMGSGWGRYTVNDAALRHGVSVERETGDADEAYARFQDPRRTRYRDGSLPN